jgi:hypothetical protein
MIVRGKSRDVFPDDYLDDSQVARPKRTQSMITTPCKQRRYLYDGCEAFCRRVFIVDVEVTRRADFGTYFLLHFFTTTIARSDNGTIQTSYHNNTIIRPIVRRRQLLANILAFHIIEYIHLELAHI